MPTPLAVQLFILPSMALLLASCAQTPSFDLRLPAQASGPIKRESFPQGKSLWKENHGNAGPPAPLAERPMSAISGQWNDPAFARYAGGGYGAGAQRRDWTVRVEAGISPKVQRALSSARDGYEADLGEVTYASARIYPRFIRKRFPWGNAVSFLVQYQNDNTNFVPNNGMLCYEVHGITDDHRYTVWARFGVTHPRLKEFGPGVRDHRPTAQDRTWPDPRMTKDPDYVLVERCAEEEFQPSLRDIDALLNTVKPNRSR